MKNFLTVCFAVLALFSARSFAQIPTKVLVSIVKAEDERRFDRTLEDLMKNADAKIRVRAALAAGRIGDEKAISLLTNLLEKDTDEVRETAAFALGEIESAKAADAVWLHLSNKKHLPEVRARLIEAAGKIAAANPKDEKSKILGAAILETLDFEDEKRSGPYKNIIELGLTAILRARPENAEKTLVRFIDAYTPKIRANALNALARLRAKTANAQARELLQKDADAVVRANAARVLGAAEDKDAFDILLKAATTDADSRVRVSAIRGLGNLKDKRAAEKLIERGGELLKDYAMGKTMVVYPRQKSEFLEIVGTLGRILPDSNDETAVSVLQAFRDLNKIPSPEVEIAYAKIAPADYLRNYPGKNQTASWQTVSAIAQGLGEYANQTDANLRGQGGDALLNYFSTFIANTKPAQEAEMSKAIPDLLRTIAAFKPAMLPDLLREFIASKDVTTRATAAELFGELPSSDENYKALENAFVSAMVTDKQSNDAQLAMLDALYKLDAKRAEKSLQIALVAPDYLVRQKAMQLIKNGDAANVSPALKTALEKSYKTVEPFFAAYKTKLGQIFYTNADYLRAVSRKSAKAILTTAKGNFTIEFFPEEAPLTVDNFIKLANANYFNGLAIHRVVPNFVMQDGDPRGDGNGGPGWQIRCELNMQEYERGAVGMALSGKDTGGSQWFVTHSPQPHLDGGYTVFGRVNETDMKVVDNLVRGDKIISVKIIEGNALPRAANGRGGK